MLISLAEYAEKHGKQRTSVSDMARAGAFKTAVKIGRNWCVDSDEPYPDRRVKSGKYKNWRKKKESG